MRCDLHVHTTYSDGSFSVGEILDLAKHIGLDGIAISDHDTTNGVPEALAYGKEIGLHVIPAIELSADCGVPVHILGYNMDYNNPDFQLELDALQEKRNIRKDKILAKLEKYNIIIDSSKLPILNVGRSHIARELLCGGFVSSIQEAFDRYLGENRLAYFPGDRLTPMTAVQMIAKFGGQSVIAHPLKLHQTKRLELMIQGLLPYGLGGLECQYPSHTKDDAVTLEAIAAKYKLFTTGGSDFHGIYKGQGNSLGICTCELPKQLH